jgi:hypothetical protein
VDEIPASFRWILGREIEDELAGKGQISLRSAMGSLSDIALDGGLVGFGADSELSRSRAKPHSG